MGKRLLGAVIVAVLLTSLGVVGSPVSSAAPVVGANVLYTSDANFDSGTTVNLNHTAPNNNKLQLNETSGTFPFIWVALSQRCTIAKINTATGAILGEFRTVSDATFCAESSRTTVGVDGSVWVGHRGYGGVTHVGLKELNECIDRNGNGTIETSTGYGDVKPWSGTDTGVASAGDECIIHHVNTHLAPLNMMDSRHMSIDRSNNLWVGDYSGGHQFVKINGATGAVLTPVRDLPCGGYGGLIDRNGVIWSANGTAEGLLRWNPNVADSATNPRCIMGFGVYGLAADAAGSIFVTDLYSSIVKVANDGNSFTGPVGIGQAQGLAVDGNGDVWTSSSLFCSFDCTIRHLKNDLTFVGTVPNPTGAGSTGISVDATGKVWSANLNSNTATRINPALGGPGADPGATPIGAVDLTVEFPATPDGRPLPYPYNYSDMTGAQLLTSTSPQGSWTITQDGTASNTPWGKITWNTEAAGASQPAGSTIVVQARAANTEAGLGALAFTPITNNTSFNLVGRFIQVRVTLAPNSAGDSPVLSDIRIASSGLTNSPTTCVVTAVRAGPPAQQDVTVRDLDGIASITAINVINGTVAVPTFTPGVKTPIVLTATKINQTQKTFWEFDVTDSKGVRKHCV